MTDRASSSIVPRPHTAQSNFEGDCLDRKKVGDRLTRLVSRLEGGGVIGVDGKWGEGKTWLATHWLASLGIDRTTVKVDAFECDFQDDPFASISQALYEAIKVKGGNEAVKGKVVSGLVATAKAIGVGTARIGVNYLTGGAAEPMLKAAGELAERALDAAGQAGEDAINEWLTSAERRRSALQCLKAAIEEYVASQEKQEPLVIVIDELDRCRPSYALRMLDVLKHLFDMPGIVFVLFVNREQLEGTVSRQFGRFVGAGYLGKFVHVWVALTPQDDPTGDLAANAYTELLNSFFERMNLAKVAGSVWAGFVEVLAWYAVSMRLQARDLERVATAVAVPPNFLEVVFDEMVPWLVTLKVMHPQVYQGLLRDDTSAHLQAADLAQAAAERIASHRFSGVLAGLQTMHRHLSSSGRDWAEMSGTANRVWKFGTKREAVMAINRVLNILEA